MEAAKLRLIISRRAIAYEFIDDEEHQRFLTEKVIIVCDWCMDKETFQEDEAGSKPFNLAYCSRWAPKSRRSHLGNLPLIVNR